MMKFTLVAIVLFALIATVFSWEDKHEHDDYSQHTCPKDVHCDNLHDIHIPNVCPSLNYLVCKEQALTAVTGPGSIVTLLGDLATALLPVNLGTIGPGGIDPVLVALANLLAGVFTTLTTPGTCTPPTGPNLCFVPPSGPVA
jgi:hypothetical protein